MMMMMMNCSCGLVDRRKAFSLTSSWDHFRYLYHRESPTRREQDLDLRRTWVQAFLNEENYGISLETRFMTALAKVNKNVFQGL